MSIGGAGAFPRRSWLGPPGALRMVRFGHDSNGDPDRGIEASVSTSFIARGRETRPTLAPWLFPGTAALLAILFVAFPGSIADKAHLAVHGLCAQTPSHSLILGGQRLPFDARMTGIYAGALSTSAWLFWRGRFRGWLLPPPRVVVALVASVAAMGVDGANSLARDLGFATPYAPNNTLRLATGLATGTALATALCFLLATTLWRTGENRAAVAGMREWGLLGLIQLPIAAALLSGIGVFYAPAALLLVVAAGGVIAALLAASGLLALGRDRRCLAWSDAAFAGTLALLGSVAIMALAACGRLALEAAVGPSPLT